MRPLPLLRSLVSVARGPVCTGSTLARPSVRLDSVLAASLAISSACLVFSHENAQAQDAGTTAAPVEPQAEPVEPEAVEAEAADPAPAAPPAEPEQAGPVLEPPSMTPLELDPKTTAAGSSAPKPPPALAPIERKGWTAPETIFHLHGYLRMRGSLLKDGALGHTPQYDRLPTNPTSRDTNGEVVPGTPRQNYDPFPFFAPADSTSNYESKASDSGNDGAENMNPVEGGCGGGYRGDGRCSKKTQVGGDLRLRLKPEIHLSDDVRVKAWVDVLDNVGLGTLGYGPNNTVSDFELDRGNTLRVRRAWGEARNRDIGELRFGRMGADWGLGILDNGGDRNGIDSDFSSDVDRVMGITNLAGFYLMAAYDWASQGKVTPGSATPSGVPVDRAQRDDLSALTLAAAHRLDSELQRSTLQRGESVFNYGAYFIYRRQLLRNDTLEPVDGSRFVRFDQKQFVPDLWAQFLWEGLRVELEGAFVAGELEGACPTLRGNSPNSYEERVTLGPNGRDTSGSCKFRQLGVALETEYRLFEDRLGIHFNSGFASGDNNAYGLAQTNDPSLQREAGNSSSDRRTISTYQFHPDYRVDLILWRTLMRRVAGGYYFKPGVSYDFIRDPYGQQAGARVDVIYSRAAAAQQTYGHSGNLGLELDVSLYYRSEDGPDVLDGFYSTLQWGILFPFQGLEYAGGGNLPSSKNAMILRGVVGIAF